MSTELVNKVAQTGLAAFTGGVNPFTQYADDVGVGNNAYMTFNGNTGIYADHKRQTIEYGTAMLFDLEKTQVGWIGWKGSKPVHQLLVSLISGERPIEEQDLPDINPQPGSTDGWRKVARFPVYFADGGPALDFTLPAHLPWSPVNKLIKEFGEKAKFQIDSDTGLVKVPLVTLNASDFQTNYGKKYAPVFEIVDWWTRTEVDALIADSVEPPGEEASGDPVDNGAAQQAETPPQQTAARPATHPAAPQQVATSAPQANTVAASRTRPMQRPVRPGKRV
jgi:hypothetical protein